MLGFSDTWRKRLACERCRHLKVRCEYSSPTNDTCIRCEKSNTPCIIATPKRKGGNHSTGTANTVNSHTKSSSVSSNNSMVSHSRMQLPHTPSPETQPSSNTSDEENMDSVISRSKAEHAVYLQRIILDAKQKLEEINVSPLTQALNTGFYTLAEVTGYYNKFLMYPSIFPFISILRLPHDIMELDKEWPWLTIAIVSSRAINTTDKPQNEIMVFLQDLLMCPVDNFGQRLTLDRLAALALICQYASTSHVDRTMATLFHLHSMVVSCVRKFHAERKFKEEKIALHLGAVTVLPYTVIKGFSPLNHVLHYYLTVMNTGEESFDGTLLDPSCDCVVDQIPPAPSPQNFPDVCTFTAGLLIEMLRGYSRALGMIASATDILQIRNTVECCIQSISLLENQAAAVYHQLANGDVFNAANAEIPVNENISLFPLRGCYVMVKMKILKLAVVKMLRLSAVDSPDSEKVSMCFKYVISQGANHSSQLFRIFAYADANSPLLPTTMFYYVPEALITLQLMRFAAFASAIDIDVRSDCLTQVVMLKWEELVRSSIMARLLFFLLFPALDTSNVKIGETSAEHAVVGSGLMREFNIIFCEGSVKEIRDQFRISRESFREVIQAVLRQGEAGNDSSPAWFENLNTLSLPSVIHLLLFKL